MLKRRSEKRYRRCLARIDRLERELFPEWFPEDELAVLDFSPGAIWTVDNPSNVSFINNHFILHRQEFCA